MKTCRRPLLSAGVLDKPDVDLGRPDRAPETDPGLGAGETDDIKETGAPKHYAMAHCYSPFFTMRVLRQCAALSRWADGTWDFLKVPIHVLLRVHET